MPALEIAVNLVAQLIPIVCYGITGYVTGRFWAMSQFRKRLHKIAANRRSANAARRRENEALTARNAELREELRATAIPPPQPIDIGQALQETIQLRRRERRRQQALARREEHYRRLEL